jgi:arginine repressor
MKLSKILKEIQIQRFRFDDVHRYEAEYKGGSKDIDKLMRADQFVYSYSLGNNYVCLAPSHGQFIHIFRKKYFDMHEDGFKTIREGEMEYIKNEINKGNYKIYG